MSGHRLTLIRVYLISCLFALLMPVQLHFVRENLPFVLAVLTFIVAPGLEVGMMQLMKVLPSPLTRCRSEQKSVEVAIREVGQLLNVGHLSGVTYDVPQSVADGTNHLHVTFMLIRVDDEQ